MRPPAYRSFDTRGGVRLDFSLTAFGCAPLGNMHHALSNDEASDVLTTAWAAGCRYFDTAPLYGHGLSEARVGAFLGEYPASEYLLSTKVGRLLEPCAAGEEGAGIYKFTPQMRARFDYSRDGVMRSYEDSVRRLGGLRPDILLVHDLDPVTHLDDESRWRELLDGGGWSALAELRANGDVKAVGAGLNEVGPCLRLLREADPDLFLIAGRHTLLDRTASRDLFPACGQRRVGVIVGGPFNSGILATGSRPGAMYAYAPASQQVLDRVAAIESVCGAYGIDLPTAAIQFTVRDPAVLCVLPGGQTPEQVRANAAAMNTEIPQALWRDLDAAVGASGLEAGAVC